MKRKGFTLIELLAVIVVLAIIALIATPIVMNTIKNAKKGAAERTADNYIKQVETAVAEAKLGNNSIPNGTYDIDGNGNLTGAALPNGKLEIDMSGNKPNGGTIKIKNGGVSKDGTKLIVGDYNVKYKDDKLTATDPYKGVLCKANTQEVEALVYDNAAQGYPPVLSSYTRKKVGLLSSKTASKYDIGVTYTCDLGDSEDSKNLTFYVLEEDGDNISLIMSENLGAPVAWVTKEDYLAAGGTENDWPGNSANNNLGPITANKALVERTKGWTKSEDIQISLPTKEQIENAYEGTMPEWLHSYTNFVAGTFGYWTSTAGTSAGWSAVEISLGNVETNNIVCSDYGVRPVITISKSNLS